MIVLKRPYLRAATLSGRSILSSIQGYSSLSTALKVKQALMLSPLIYGIVTRNKGTGMLGFTEAIRCKNFLVAACFSAAKP